MLKAILLSALLMAASSSALAQNQGLPASKSAVQVSNVALLSSVNGLSTNWTTILATQIKTAPKELLIGVSLQTGLLTRTRISTGSADSRAQASIKVRVLIDGRVGEPGRVFAERLAEPGEVIYARRTQELSGSLAGILTGCTGVNNPVTNVVTLNTCNFAPQTLQFLLDTMNANAFNFVLPNLGVGIHNVKVQAKIDIGPDAGVAEARALIGKGSLVVEQIRLVRGADILTTDSTR